MGFDLSRVASAQEVLTAAYRHARFYAGIWSGWGLLDQSMVTRSRRVALGIRTSGLIDHDRILRATTR